MKKNLGDFLKRLDEQTDFDPKKEASNLMVQALAWLSDEAHDSFGEDAEAVMSEVKKMLKDPSIADKI